MIAPPLSPDAERRLAALATAVVEEIIALETEEPSERRELRAQGWRDTLGAALPVLAALGVVGIGLPKCGEEHS
jgi:hypothetical protein